MTEELLSKLGYKYKSGEVEKGANKASLVYTIKSKDFGQFASEVQKLGMQGVSGEDLVKKLKIDDLKDVERDMTFKLIKEDGKWLIENADEIAAKLFLG